MIADPSGSMCPGTFASVDVAFHCLRRMRQDRPRLGHAEQQGFVAGVARILRQGACTPGRGFERSRDSYAFPPDRESIAKFCGRTLPRFRQASDFPPRSAGSRPSAYPRRCPAEFKTFRPMIVRCQALTPGNASKHLHSAQPRT